MDGLWGNPHFRKPPHDYMIYYTSVGTFIASATSLVSCSAVIAISVWRISCGRFVMTVCGGFHGHGGTQKCLVFLRENPIDG